MPLTRALFDHADATSRSRGEEYARARRVVIRRRGEALVEADVYGTRRYTVAFAAEGPRLHVACACPRYQQDGGVCKHLWAAALAADQAGAMAALSPSPRVLFSPGPDAVVGRLAPRDGTGPGPRDRSPVDVRRLPAAGDDQPREERVTSPAEPDAEKAVPAEEADWRGELETLAEVVRHQHDPALAAWPPDRRLYYLVDADATLDGLGLVVEVLSSDVRATGEYGAPRARRVAPSQVAMVPDPDDQRILGALLGARSPSYGYSADETTATSRFRLYPPLDTQLLPIMCRTGRCRLRSLAHDEALTTLAWDDEGPWQLVVTVTRDEAARRYRIGGHLARGDARMALDEPRLLVSGGLVITRDRIAPLVDEGQFGWIALLLREEHLAVPFEEGAALLDRLVDVPRLPALELPPELALDTRTVTPAPRLRLRFDPARQRTLTRVSAELWFAYDEVVVAASDPASCAVSTAARRLYARDIRAERAAADRLRRLGLRPQGRRERGRYEVATSVVAGLVRTLLDEGWHVEAEGRRYQRAHRPRFEVRSGIDWFDLDARVTFGDRDVGLPELLAAARRGDGFVALDDGSIGLVPEEWLERLARLAGTGDLESGRLRFAGAQAPLLDALLEGLPEVTLDAAFAALRHDLDRFGGIEPLDPPASFQGTLRDYQREGLGWLAFLERYGFGGCLADDMGLGKTVMVLAHLAARPPGSGPSLIVVPRSLAFNWRLEAARFTPHLRVTEHMGAGRVTAAGHLAAFDLVITTYGTLRRDILALREVDFDVVVLDEAQAIKNSFTASAKAVRLLKGRQRLALSGTPVENHLGELWSLFEFLNPGMLGRSSLWHAGTSARALDEDSRVLLARALRPFILRRTKAQVARELPDKMEQTLFCDLEGPQRALYEELRQHYRETLLRQVDRDGLARMRMQVLEALLRLRQAACHPGLVDRRRTSSPSAKLDALLPLVSEVVEEGHKALVFSQFTSLLAIVRERFDAAGVRYAYLDGQTRDRDARVKRFQEDPACPVFLISLRAGGLGLNLTAAEYVFLLDPWWNPAVEMQAIDRTHRIGQTRQVFAYRLIARDTVEEKVLELQRTKRDLADAIISSENASMVSLGREDLELLLS